MVRGYSRMTAVRLDVTIREPKEGCIRENSRSIRGNPRPGFGVRRRCQTAHVPNGARPERRAGDRVWGTLSATRSHTDCVPKNLGRGFSRMVRGCSRMTAVRVDATIREPKEEVYSRKSAFDPRKSASWVFGCLINRDLGVSHLIRRRDGLRIPARNTLETLLDDTASIFEAESSDLLLGPRRSPRIAEDCSETVRAPLTSSRSEGSLNCCCSPPRVLPLSPNPCPPNKHRPASSAARRVRQR